MMRKLREWMLLGAAMLSFSGLAFASTGFSFSMGTDNFYASVGNYDYLPYAYSNYGYGTPRINFFDVMGEYGSWSSLSPFGRVWRPYVAAGWRPYVQGHWTYTRYGPTWVGYEPWAWAAYHYGNWVWTQGFGWVWVPGYEWHPGRVTWSHGYNAIGWMPSPPYGYDYSRGYLDYRGGYNQFDYYDNDFGYYDDYDDYGHYDDYYGGYHDPRYNDLFYNSGYRNIVVNLWIFIDTRHFGYSNYYDCYLDHNFTRNLFDRRLVRISSRPLQRTVLEKVVRQRIREVPVRERELQTERRRVKLVVPEGEERQIRQNANRVVKQVIAPAFAKERKNFKGLQSKNTQQVNKLFGQENRRPEIRKLSSDQIIQESKKIERDTGLRRQKIVREKAEQVQKIERERQSREQKKTPSVSERKVEKNHDAQFERAPAGRSSSAKPVQPDNGRRFETRTDTDSRKRESRDAEFQRGRSDQTSAKGTDNRSSKTRESQFEVKKSPPTRTEQQERLRAPERRPEPRNSEVRRPEPQRRPEPRSSEVRRPEPQRRPEPRSSEVRRPEPQRRPEPRSSEVRRYEPPKRVETRPQPRIEERRPQPRIEERRPQPKVEERRPQQIEPRRDSRDSRLSAPQKGSDARENSKKKSEESKEKNNSKKKDRQDSKKDRN